MCCYDNIFGEIIKGKLIPINGLYLGSKRMCEFKLRRLMEFFNVEFAQLYFVKKIKKFSDGSTKKEGGFYLLYRGDNSSVDFPVINDIIVINHTHPSGSR